MQVLPVFAPDTYNWVPVPQPTPSQRMQKEFSKPKPLSSTPPVQNKTTPKTKTKNKKETPSNDIKQRIFNARIVLYRSHHYDMHFRACAPYHLVDKHPLQQKIYIFTTKKEKMKLSPH